MLRSEQYRVALGEVLIRSLRIVPLRVAPLGVLELFFAASHNSCHWESFPAICRRSSGVAASLSHTAGGFLSQCSSGTMSNPFGSTPNAALMGLIPNAEWLLELYAYSAYGSNPTQLSC